MDFFEIALDPRDQLDGVHRGGVAGDLGIAANALRPRLDHRDRLVRLRRELCRHLCRTRGRGGRDLGFGCRGHIEWPRISLRRSIPCSNTDDHGERDWHIQVHSDLTIRAAEGWD